ncbi:hypothetical protein [Blastochloris sulfoviridis]|uniref:YtxH domain-containing protein n=1 Tax=Blastochloris sulfoviridis TaxID=50712 RepID=A0A5M6I3W9_9HYPH|nr:hypothetical protein [Blastochloris sulfoviridis]KAA5602862.1 hypothetical protein F1193_03220 [Blastochloris sulfoviridis]
MSDKTDDKTPQQPAWGGAPYGPGPYGPGPYGPGAYGPHAYGPGPFGPSAYGPYGPAGFAPGEPSGPHDDAAEARRAGYWPGCPPGWGPGSGPGWGPGWGYHHGHAPWAPGGPAPGWWGPAWGAPPPRAADKDDESSLFTSGLGVHNDALIKGLLIGAGLTFLLTNDSVQKNLIGAAVKVWSTLQGGVEEMKERFRDAEAELAAGEDDPAK